MPAISVTRSAFTLTTTSRTVSVDVVVGDRVIVKASGSGSNGAISVSDGQSLTWTPTAVTDSGYTPVRVFTSSPVTAAGSLTVTLTRASGSSYWGADVEVWRSVDTFGSPVTGKGSSGAPSLSVTTTAANSAVTWMSGDKNSVSVSTRTWNTTAGSVTENYAATPGASIYTSWWADTGAAGSKTVGLTKPTGQKWSAIAVPITFLAQVSTATVTSWKVRAHTSTAVTTSWNVQPLRVAKATATSWNVRAHTAKAITTSWNVRSRGTWQEYIRAPWWATAVTSPRRRLSWRTEIVDQSGAHVDELPGISGAVDFRGEAVEQWACSLTLTDPAAVPRTYRDALDPRSGLRARVWWRILVDGAWAEVPVGTYVLEDHSIQDDGASLGISVKGVDALTLARRGGYGLAVIDLGGLTVSAALRKIFATVAPYRPIQIGTSTVTLPAVYEVGDKDPSDDWTAIAKMAGWVVRSDREGVIVAGPPPSPSAIVADWQEGPACPVVDMSVDVSTSGIRNRVYVRSTSTAVTPPIAVLVEDDDPGSPTWVGRYGPYPEYVDSDVIATTEGALNVGRLTLGRLLAPQRSVKVSVPPRPDLGYRDLIALARARVALSGVHQMSAFRLPLPAADQGPGLMQVTMMTQALP